MGTFNTFSNWQNGIVVCASMIALDLGTGRTFIDSIMTSFAITVMSVWPTSEAGAVLTPSDLEAAMPGIGSYLPAISLLLLSPTVIKLTRDCLPDPENH